MAGWSIGPYGEGDFGVGNPNALVNVTGVEDPSLGTEIFILPLDCPATETVLALVLFDINIVFDGDVLTV